MAQKVVLTEVRKGQIALIIMKHEFTQKAHTLNRTDIMRRLGQAAEQLKGQGVSKEELIELYKEFIEEAVKKLF
ncbi:MAG TPA: hypothetical protein VFD51_02105 [Patescibacteria group bacterium]|nr:hypothetical protein [Patescibacteria group bacterium]